MVDWATVVMTGFAMGIGSETSRVIHELYIKPKILKLKQHVDSIPTEIKRIQDETKMGDNIDRTIREETGRNS
jgi:hypothetical protein